MEYLHYLAATDAVAAFRRRLLSPVELMQAVIAQAERVEALARVALAASTTTLANGGDIAGSILVGSTYEDARVFQAAAAYEAMFTLPPCPSVVGGSCG